MKIKTPSNGRENYWLPLQGCGIDSEKVELVGTIQTRESLSLQPKFYTRAVLITKI